VGKLLRPQFVLWFTRLRADPSPRATQAVCRTLGENPVVRDELFCRLAQQDAVPELDRLLSSARKNSSNSCKPPSSDMLSQTPPTLPPITN
jgi:hypothetical protein